MSLFPISSYAGGADAVRPVVSEATQAVRAPATPSTPVKAVNQAAAVTDVQRTSEKKNLDQAVDAINKFLSPVSSSIQFSIDEESGRTLVKVIDTNTNDVLRQFPSKDALAISRQLDRLQGLLLREKA